MLCRLEESTGLAFRFIIGKTHDRSKMAALKKEVEEYDDFVLLDIDEALAFFKAAYALFDSDFYVKADDDIYLRPDRLSLLLAKERRHTQTYIGCMKKGPVFTDPKLKWHEPLGYMLGKEYFLHAYGPIYALSADVVASLVALRNNRQVCNYIMSKLPFWSLRFGHFCHFSPKLKPFAFGSLWFQFYCHFGPKVKSGHICLIKSCHFVLFLRGKMVILNKIRSLTYIKPNQQSNFI
ncbi:putative glycosyl transferase, family 31 [Helianthus annuus]|uniref:Hexosyltransferase n=1 Tax=Helianthus annuus TaxID=4232 RepID=A0A9K3MZE4_HELAN|nr:putative glycosyl transferase, family 31 [Helianthus annuus]